MIYWSLCVTITRKDAITDEMSLAQTFFFSLMLKTALISRPSLIETDVLA